MVAKSKDSLKACFENVNILLIIIILHKPCFYTLTDAVLCLIVSSADNLCKQF